MFVFSNLPMEMNKEIDDFLQGQLEVEHQQRLVVWRQEHKQAFDYVLEELEDKTYLIQWQLLEQQPKAGYFVSRNCTCCGSNDLGVHDRKCLECGAFAPIMGWALYEHQ